VGALTGNASTATALASSGAIAITGDTTSTGGPYTYTSGGAISIATTIADTTVTGKVLTNLATPTSSAIAATDTILAAMAKLQGQITGLAGSLAFEGTWDASAGTAPSATPLNGQFWIVSVAGNTNLDGITDWLVGDWAIYVNNGAGTDAWQKLDQSNEVLGSGAANKIAKWTSTNTLATGLIADDGTTVTVGNSGNFIVEGNTTLGDADTDSTTVKGPAVFEETSRFNVGISLGATTYGTAGQVLTSGGGAASVNTWTTPTTGTVTSVTAGTGITIGGTAADPTVAIDYLGTDNAILSAPQENGIATTDTVWFSDATDDNIKKTTVANLIALDGARSLAATLAIGNTSGANDIIMADDQKVNFGTGSDLQIYHNGTTNNSNIDNDTGDLYITQNTDDGDIIFRSDDGGGGVGEYFKVDGSLLQTVFSKPTRHVDGMASSFGNSYDLNIYHTGTDSYIDATTSNLLIRNTFNDGDIQLMSDDGSGGVATYLYLDGGSVITRFLKDTRHSDNVKANFGDGSDLEIYHDGSNSYITDSGTGNLIVASSAFQVKRGTDLLIETTSADNVKLYNNTNLRLETTQTGLTIYGDETVNGSIMAFSTATAPAVPSAAELLLRRDNGPSINNQIGKIQFQAENPASSNNWVAGAQIIATAAATWSGTVKDTKLDFYTFEGNASSNRLTIQANGDARFYENVEIDGNLTVDGNIIHGGTGNGGTYNFNDTVNATSNENIFSIQANNGAQAFTVYFTCNTTGVSVAKVYTVVHSYGTTVVYNKLVDSGPYGGVAADDFTPTFTGATDTVTCNIANLSSTNLNIVTTVVLGGSPTALTVTAL